MKNKVFICLFLASFTAMSSIAFAARRLTLEDYNGKYVANVTSPQNHICRETNAP